MHTEPVPKLLVSEREAGALLSICPKSVYLLRRRGLLPGVHVGRSIRYDLNDLRAFIARQKAVQAQEVRA